MTEGSDRPAAKARRRRRKWVVPVAAGLAVVVGLVAILALLRPNFLVSPEAGGHLAEVCRPLQVIDAETGLPLRGIEDLAVLPDGSSILSAYDRWSVEDGVTAGQRSAPGGLYRLEAPADRWTADRTTSIEAQNLTGAVLPEIRPHGIDVIAKSDGGVRIFAVNRATGPARDRVAVDVFDLADTDLRHVARIADPRLCRANDIAAVDERHAFLTLDTSACGGPARWRELVLGPPAGAVLRLTLSDDVLEGSAGDDKQTAQLAPIAHGLRFANGIAVDGQWVWIAETRGQALMRLPLETALQGNATLTAGSLPSPHRYPLAAAPDNLTIDADGALLVTQHPSLLRLALHRPAWLRLGRPGTRVDRVAPGDGGAIESRLEWLDPQGTLLPAGTVAAEVPGALLIGSVTADGLAFCPS